MSYDTPLTPYQQPPGIFSPTPPYSYNELLSNPAHYHLPLPEPALVDHHESCERQYVELQTKFEKSEEENKRLRDLIETLGDALIGTADSAQQNAFATQNIFAATGIKLLGIHKQLDDLSFRRHSDLKAVRDKVLQIGKDLMNGMTKQRFHLDKVNHMRGSVPPQVVETEDKQASTKTDAGKEGVGFRQMTTLPNEQ